MNESPKEKLSQISRDEINVINDIRDLNFGKINIVIQDGVIVSKEITRVIKRSKNRNDKKQNDGGYNNEEEIY